MRILSRFNHLSTESFMASLIPASVYETAATQLTYDPTSKSGLRWVNGKEAGCLDSTGYWKVRIGARPGIGLYAHRLVWWMHHQTLSEQLDHRDRDRSNNRIENLREASRAENQRNRRRARNNQAGAKNVCWDEANKAWRVQVDAAGKTRTRYMQTREAAVEQARLLRQELHGAYALAGDL